MRQLQPHVHPLRSAKGEARERRIDHKPRWTLRRTRLVKHVVRLLRLNPKAGSRELQMNVSVKRPVADLSSFRDRETLRLEHHVQRREPVIHIFHSPFCGVGEFVDQGSNSLWPRYCAHGKWQ